MCPARVSDVAAWGTSVARWCRLLLCVCVCVFCATTLCGDVGLCGKGRAPVGCSIRRERFAADRVDLWWLCVHLISCCCASLAPLLVAVAVAVAVAASGSRRRPIPLVSWSINLNYHGDPSSWFCLFVSDDRPRGRTNLELVGLWTISTPLAPPTPFLGVVLQVRRRCGQADIFGTCTCYGRERASAFVAVHFS